MHRVGSSDLEVSTLCLGTDVFGWTASGGDSEAIIGSWLAADPVRRDRIDLLWASARTVQLTLSDGEVAQPSASA